MKHSNTKGRSGVGYSIENPYVFRKYGKFDGIITEIK
jgi:hypothetical protein